MEHLFLLNQTRQADQTGSSRSRSSHHNGAFADPLDRPEWRGLMPLLRIYTSLIR